MRAIDQWIEGEDMDEHEMELVAFTPGDLVGAQRNLVTWCEGRIARAGNLVAEASGRVEAARGAMEIDLFQRQLGRERQHLTFYQKLLAAVREGYLIVPNFPIDVFAVRTTLQRPSTGLGANWPRGVPSVPAQRLPAGAGRYVSLRPSVFRDDVPERQSDGSTKVVQKWFADEMEDVAFPVALVKPAVLGATARALALKIFDEIGLVGESPKADPIVVGRIYHPSHRRYAMRAVTFFVAWWLNTERL